jgi:ketosteroid isomerase-like protein
MKETTYKNVKLLKGFYEAVSRGDMDAARTLLDPNVEWIEPYLPGL